MNCLNYELNAEVKDFYNNTFQHGAIPLINKPTRVTASTATLIDNILTNSFFEASLKKGIIKTSVSDHFPVFAALNISKNKRSTSDKIEITKRNFSERNKASFKKDLKKADWSILNRRENANIIYESFLEIFLKLYEKHFPLQKQVIKTKDLLTPWMTKGMKKSSKQKQKLYIKYLKNKTEETESTYKNYKNLFEKLRKKGKQIYYSSLIEKYKNDSKKTWQVIKDITGKKKNKLNNLPKMLKIEKGFIYEQKQIAHEFNEFFTNIGSNLANKIPKVQKSLLLKTI